MKHSPPYSQCAAAAAIFFLSLGYATAFRKPEHDSLPNMDTRQSVAALNGVPSAAPQARAAATKLATLVDGAVVSFDPLIGSPRLITAPDGFLTGPGGHGNAVKESSLSAFAANDSLRVVKAFMNDHAALFGGGAGLLDSTVIQSDSTSPGGIRSVIWQQLVDGIPVYNGTLSAHISQQGELIRMSSLLTPNSTALAVRLANPISPQRAVSAAAGNIGVVVSTNELVISKASAGASQLQTFAPVSAKLVGETYVQLRWLPTDGATLRLCWDIYVKSRTNNEVYEILVDAETAKPLKRSIRTRYFTPATYNIYDSDSPTPFSPGWPTPNSAQPPYVPRTNLTIGALSTNDSPNGWLPDTGTNTIGNNVDAHLDHNDDDIADPGSRPVTTNRIFNFAINFTNSPTTYTNASVVQLFYLNNWMHDKLYELGFTEAAGNFQTLNFGRGGNAGDAIQADGQDGGGTDNANMATYPDGIPPRMQMYLFSSPNPDRDGDFDADVVLHEHTHGLSNRLIGNGSGLDNTQSGGMGEGWSDFYALSLLTSPTDNVSGCYAMGGYATYQFFGLQENYYFGIRRYPYCTNMLKNPLTFKDIDPAQAIPHTGIPLSSIYSPFNAASADEVHAEGEVWCSALHEVRVNLVNKYGGSVGTHLALQLVTDGMKLSPIEPNFLEARDAILAADEADNAGINRAEIWRGFAKRGMGYSAKSPASTTTSGLVEAYDLPPGVVVRLANAVLVSESCAPTNGVIDPEESVTVRFALNNIGIIDNASNVVAALLTNAGVDNVSAPQPYGTLFGNGANIVTQSFSFTAHGTCGGLISTVLQIASGTNDLGTISTDWLLGKPTTSRVTTVAQSFDTVVAPALPSGWSTTFGGLQQPWKTSAYLPNSAPNCAFSTDNSGVGDNALVSPSFLVLSGGASLTFTHNYILQAPTTGTVGYDGGVLEIDIGGTGFQDILAAGGAFVQNGYDRTISTRNGNPLAGRDAWSGNSGGYLTTIVSLPGTAAGKSCRLRWRLGTDSITGAAGWRVDDIQLTDALYNCCGGSDLAIGLGSSPQTAIAGQPLLLSVYVTNNGPGAAANVMVTNILPSAVSFTSVSSSPGSAVYTNGQVIYSIGSMSSGSVATAGILLVPSNQLPLIFYLTNFAAVTTSIVDSFNGNNIASLLLSVAKDSVGDGIPDWWRSQNFGGSGDISTTTNCATCDPDGDGRSNLQEFLADTIPTNAASLLKIVAISNQPPAAFTFFPSSTGRVYTLEYATSLNTGNWSTVTGQSGIYGNGGVYSLPDTNSPAANFYRIKATLP